MKESLRLFSINDINLFKSDDDVDFAMAELEFMSDGDNGQNSPITLEALKRDSKTVLGKFIVAKYDKLKDDVTTHVLDEVICGYVPPDSEVTFREKNGRTFAVCQAVISKLYATEVFLLFKKDNYRAVSAEFSALQPNPNEFGEGEITAFDIRAITILGKTVDPAIRNANIQIKKFSAEEASEFYNEQKNPLKEFAEKRRDKMFESKSYKINKTELKEGSWGAVDKSALRKAVMDAKNRDRLVNTVYLLVEDGWEDSPSEHLKYPVMELSGDTFYYNKGGIESAKGFAKAEDESEVLAKISKLEKKFNLGEHHKDKEKEGKEEKKMEGKKFSQLEGREIYGEVIKRVQAKLGKDMYVEEIYNNHVEVKKASTGEIYTIPADITIGKDDEDMKISIDYDKMKKSSEQKQFSEDKKEDEDKDKKEDEDKKEDKEEDKPEEKKEEVKKASAKKSKKKMEHDEEVDPDKEEEEADEDISDEEKKFEDKEEDKEFSLNEDADAGATFERLVEETNKNKELSDEDKKLYSELWSSKNPDLIMEHMSKMSKEMSELRAFKADVETKQCEATFAKEMSKVKGKIDEKAYKEFYEKGDKIKTEKEMKAFSMELRSFAWDYVTDESETSKDTIMKYGGITRENSNKNMSVFERISSK